MLPWLGVKCSLILKDKARFQSLHGLLLSANITNICPKRTPWIREYCVHRARGPARVGDPVLPWKHKVWYTISNIVSRWSSGEQLVMPNGKSTRVIFLEYTEGVTLAESQNKYPSHKYPQYKPLPDESYAEWLHISKEIVSNLHFHPILFSNTRRICPRATRDVHRSRMQSSPPWSQNAEYRDHVHVPPAGREYWFCVFRVQGSRAPHRRHNTWYRPVALLTDCCCQHTKDVEQWAKKYSPGGFDVSKWR